MTEPEWLERQSPEYGGSESMLGFLRGKASDRELRLFAVACWWGIASERERQALALVERFADGLATAEEIAAGWRELPTAAVNAGILDRNVEALFVAVGTVMVVSRMTTRACSYAGAGARQEGVMADLLRDIFGNPFRPVTIEPSWLRWNNGTVVKMAQAIYEERAFEHLPLLADALPMPAAITKTSSATAVRRGRMSAAAGWSISSSASVEGLSSPNVDRCCPRTARQCERRRNMFRTLEAIIDEQGNVRLLEPISLPSPRPALVTVFEEASVIQVSETALVSKAILATVKELDEISYDFDLMAILEYLQYQINQHQGTRSIENAKEDMIAFLKFVTALTESDDLKNRLEKEIAHYAPTSKLNKKLIEEIISNSNCRKYRITLYDILKKNADLFLSNEVSAAIDSVIVKNVFELASYGYHSIEHMTNRHLRTEDILYPLLRRDILSTYSTGYETYYSYTDFGKSLSRYIVKNNLQQHAI